MNRTILIPLVFLGFAAASMGCATTEAGVRKDMRKDVRYCRNKAKRGGRIYKLGKKFGNTKEELCSVHILKGCHSGMSDEECVEVKRVRVRKEMEKFYR